MNSASDNLISISDIISFILGAIISLTSTVVTLYYTSKIENRKEKQNIILLITQSNAALFSVIYQGSLNKDRIDYIKLRQELEKSNILFILPPRLRTPFEELYKIHLMDEFYYRKNKNRIYHLVVEIVSELEKYGVEFD